MSKKITQIKQFKYLETFKCIGSLCEDTCCVGWDVDIDQGTYAYYQSLADDPLSRKIKSKVRPNLTCGDKAIDFASVILSNNKHCPFLDHDKLCEIQRAYGELALSNVCTNFPRFYNQVDHVLEITGTFSCPEISRMALSDPQMMVETVTPITQKELKARRMIFSKRLDTSECQKSHPAIQHLQLIREGIETVLALPISIEKSLEWIGEYVEGIQTLTDHNQLSTFNAYHESFLKSIEDSIKTDKQHPLESNIPGMQGITLLDFYFQKLKVGSEVTDPRFIKIAEHACLGMGKKKGVSVKKYAPQFIEIYNRTTVKLLEVHRDLLKNDMRHYLFKNIFPFNGTQNLNEAYRLLVIRYAQLVWLITGMNGNLNGEQQLSQEQLIHLIQSYTKTIEHHKTYLDSVHEHLILLGNVKAVQFSKLTFLGAYVHA